MPTETTAPSTDFSKVLDKVRKLIAKAEGTDNPHEAAAFQAAADAMMLRYAIEDAMLQDSRPAAERTRPITTTITLGEHNDMLGWVASLAERVALHCRCRIRPYSSYADGTWNATVYGFESDVRYFEVLFTTIQLHMLGVLIPKVDPNASLDENAYRLHNAGYNWLEIADIYGWRKYRDLGYERKVAVRDAHPDVDFYDTDAEYWYHAENNEVRSNHHAVAGEYKRAYYRAIKVRGEQPTKIPASGSKTYRESAARGYVSRMVQRLREAASKTTGNGAEVVLAGRAEDVLDLFREASPHSYTRCPTCSKLSALAYTCDRCGARIADAPEAVGCPRCKEAKSGYCRQHRPMAYKDTPFSSAGYQAGVAHANTADLAGNKMGSSPARPISG